MASPVYAGNGGNPVFASGTSVVVPVPGSLTTGDLLIAQIWVEAQTANAPTSTGWTQAFGFAGNDTALYIYYRYASSEPANYTFTSSNATAFTGWIHHITGAITSGNPFNALGSGTSAIGATSIVTAAITTTNPSTLIMNFIGHFDGSNGVSTYPSGYTGVTYTGNSTIACSYIAQASAGSTGTATTTFVSNDDMTGVLGAISSPSSTAFTLTASNGSYAYTGEAATLTFAGATAYTLVANAGGYSYIGASSFTAYQLDGSTGVYAYTGQNAALTLNQFLTLTASPGMYAYSGPGANLIPGTGSYILPATTGVYAYTGIPATLSGGASPIPPPAPCTTNLDIIIYAYQKIGVIDENSVPSNEQGIVGLTVLNDMLLNEAADGLRLGWYAQTLLASCCPLRAEDIYGVKMMLALALAVHYGITIQDPGFLQAAKEAKRQMVKRSIRYSEADFSELSRPQGGPWGGPNWI